MKKILLSLSSIAAVAAIVAVGSTGAWWSDTAESSENTFHSGSMNLKLANMPGEPYGGQWHDEVKQTWDYEDMTPGGETFGDSLRVSNQGSTPADWLKFDTTVESSNSDGDLPMSNVLRITEFSYAGESLLEDGAGANLGDYERPNEGDCDIVVDSSTKLGNLDSNASEGDLICVDGGNYNNSTIVDVTTSDIEIAALTMPHWSNPAKVAGFKIEADNVTVRGFKIDNNDGDRGVWINDDTEGTVVESNILENSLRGVQGNWTSGGDDIIIRNNVFETDYGVAGTEDMTNLVIKGNTFNTRAEGIGVGGDASDLTIKENLFDGSHDPEYGAIKVYDTGSSDVNNLDIHYNDFENFEESAIINEQGITVNARYNWWGQATGAEDEQIEGAVNTEKHLGGPHVGFVNGEDHNDNGFADLYDLHQETVVTEEPQLEEENHQELYLETQLDGPTATNEHQGESVDLDMEITMGQGPIN